MANKELLDNLENWTIGIDETFQFHCTKCGKCCLDREDILLNPRDMYKIAHYLKIPPHEVLKKYCETYIGNSSRVPIVRLKPIGKRRRCPFLKNSKCVIHAAKPSVCAIYPLGRYTKYDKDSDTADNVSGQSVHYILQPYACGDLSESHTVRDWLKEFDFEVEDQAYIMWTNFVSRTGRLIKKCEEQMTFEKIVPLWNAILVTAYLAYDTSKNFIPQLEKNIVSLETLYDNLDRLLSEGIATTEEADPK